MSCFSPTNEDTSMFEQGIRGEGEQIVVQRCSEVSSNFFAWQQIDACPALITAEL